MNGKGGGLFYGGGLQQLVAQIVAILVTLAVSGVMTAIIGLVIHKTVGFRVSQEAELAGVDLSEHAETAYEFGGLSRSHFNALPHPFAAVELQREKQADPA